METSLAAGTDKRGKLLAFDISQQLRGVFK